MSWWIVLHTVVCLVESLAFSRRGLTLFNRQCVFAHTPSVIRSSNSTPKEPSSLRSSLAWFLHPQSSQNKIWGALRGKATQRMQAEDATHVPMASETGNRVRCAVADGHPTALNKSVTSVHLFQVRVLLCSFYSEFLGSRAIYSHHFWYIRV